jgi:hypothetical protein
MLNFKFWILNEDRGTRLAAFFSLIPHSKFLIQNSKLISHTLPLEGAIIEGRRAVWVSARRPT